MQAYSRIRQAIVEGVYQPGQRLVELRIAEELNLSRTPVREALSRLEVEGLVQSEPNRGAVVRALSIEDVADIYGLRARLEGYAAELAAARHNAEDLLELDAAMADFSAALSGQSKALEAVRATHEANRRFHTAVLAAARHDRLTRTLGGAVDVPLVFQAFREFGRIETERSHLFHGYVRDAIAAGDAVRAGNLMSEHILQGGDVLVAQLAGAADGD